MQEIETYEVSKGEEQYYHCLLEIKAYRTNQYGEPIKISTPFLQKFEKVWFRSVGLHELRQQGYSVVILFDPYEFENKQAAAKAKAEAKAETKDETEVKTRGRKKAE